MLKPAKQATGVLDVVTRNLLKFNAAVKFGKTVLSLDTQVRNVVGNISFMVANGYMTDIFTSGVSIRDALNTATAGNSIFMSRDRNFQERYQELLALGVVNTSDYREIEQMFTQYGGQDMGTAIEQMALARQTGKIGKKIAGAADAMARTYKAEDDFFKILAYEIELVRYKKAYASDPSKSEAAIQAEVAEIIANTLPNYDRVPEAIKALRLIPYVGTFPSFTAEVIRTTVGRIAITARELQSDNPNVRKIGQSRLVGMAIMLMVPSILSGVMKAISGVDDEEEKAIRSLLPYWNRDSTLLFFRKENGELSFANYGYVDPLVYFRQPIIALFGRDDANVPTRVGQAFMNIVRPFIGKEIGFGAIQDIVRGTDEFGRTVITPGSSGAEQLQEALVHIFGKVQPGSVRTIRDMIRGATGYVDDYGKRYDLGSQVMQLFTGFKMESVNVRQAFMFKVSEFNRLDRELRSRLNRVAKRQGEVAPEELVEAVNFYNNNRRAIQKQLFGHVRNMRTFGITDGELRQILQANFISEPLAADLVDGRFRPYDIGTDMLDRAVEMTRFTDREVPLSRMGEAAMRLQSMKAATMNLPRETTERLDK